MPARFLVILPLIVGLLAAFCPAWADPANRLTADEENDYFASSDDRHYTQGLRFSDLTPPLAPSSGWNQPYTWLGAVLPIFDI